MKFSTNAFQGVQITVISDLNEKGTEIGGFADINSGTLKEKLDINTHKMKLEISKTKTVTLVNKFV